jgi:hypothetical protein
VADQDDFEQPAPESEAERPLQAGDVIGQLTLVDRAARAPNGQAIWECSCSCGNIVLRYQHNLKASQKRGTKSSCKACLYKRIAVITSDRLRRKRQRRIIEAYRQAWEATGSLYTER